MPITHLRSLDVSLLVALDALLDERSVTRAGRRLQLSQPAMSRTLGRLRTAFADELLVRSGRDLVMTPRAAELKVPLRRALEGLDAAVAEPQHFEPLTARRTFTLSTTDYGSAVVLPVLLAHLARVAPSVDLVTRNQSPTWDEALREGALDVALFPRRPSSPGIVWQPMFSEHFVCLARRGHPSIRSKLSLAALCETPHVFVSPSDAAQGVVDEVLAKTGLRRRVALRVQSFLVAPLVVAESDLLALVPAQVARRFAARFELQVLPLPIEVPRFAVALAWHERMRADAGHAWFRKNLVTVAKALGPRAD
jgi:DNA-binding transcriptional LysR family regulator